MICLCTVIGVCICMYVCMHMYYGYMCCIPYIINSDIFTYVYLCTILHTHTIYLIIFFIYSVLLTIPKDVIEKGVPPSLGL